MSVTLAGGHKVSDWLGVTRSVTGWGSQGL